MKLAKNTLLSNGGQKDLYVLSVGMLKPGTLQVENSLTVKAVALKPV
jgi:hypothetical protein